MFCLLLLQSPQGLGVFCLLAQDLLKRSLKFLLPFRQLFKSLHQVLPLVSSDKSFSQHPFKGVAEFRVLPKPFGQFGH